MFRRISLLCLLGLLTACDPPPASSGRSVALTPALPCDIHNGCTARNNELAVNVRFGVIPRALQPFPVQVSIEAGQAVASVAIRFSMRDMEMGQNRYRLVAAAPHQWRGDVTLPICTSGRSDWLADIEVIAGGKTYRVAMPFVLEK